MYTIFLRRLLVIYLIFMSSASLATGTILILGDSLSAGYGLQPDQGWVSLLANQISANNFDYKIVNASVSGLTSGEGLQMLPKLLDDNQPNIFILALGSNDGLRGIPLIIMQKNLISMIEMAQAHNAAVLFIGFMLPDTLGADYVEQFRKSFQDIADKYKVAFLPFLLNGFATNENYFQEDHLHPTAAAQPLILNNVWPHLLPLLTTKN
jgi:acyl-CoA thioesterase-1